LLSLGEFFSVEQNFDLFGNPVRAGAGQRGRPAYEASDAERNKIKLLLAMGWSSQRVADAIDISIATLKRYFRAELKVRAVMRDRLDARRLEIAMEQANAGNIAALKELGKMIERSDMMLGTAAIKKAQDGAEPKVAKLGKKEAAAQDAQSAGEGSGWGNDLLFSGRQN
jgi:hypothetical protein